MIRCSNAPVRDRQACIRDEQGNPLYLPGISEDISERRRIEPALLSSERNYRLVSDNSPDMIYRMTLPEGKYEPASLIMTGATDPKGCSDAPLTT